MKIFRRFPLLIVLLAACAAQAQTSAPRTAAPPAPSSGVSFGASLGVPMIVSATDVFYNYADYAPPGLGLRYGITGALRMRIAGIDKKNLSFALIGDARYTSVFHTTSATATQSTTTSARFGMMSFGFGIEQAFGTGRTQPFFGLTLDVNAIEPGTAHTSVLDSAGYHTTDAALAGDVWQLRFGVTPRIGIRTQLTRSVSLDVTAAYQIVNLINRADYTPKNYLVDAHGREVLLSDASVSVGFLWTMPTLAKRK